MLKTEKEKEQDKEQARNLFNYIISNEAHLYSVQEIALVKTLDWILEKPEFTYANILEKILFFKDPASRDATFRIDFIVKILNNHPNLSINYTLELEYTCTPLMMLVAHGISYMAVCVLESPSINPDPFIQDNKKKTILHLLVAKGHQYDGKNYEDQRAVFEAVLNHKDIEQHINDQDVYGQTALHYAAARRDLYYIRHLLKKGADPKISDNFNRTFFEVLNLTEQERVNVIGSAVCWQEEWTTTLNYRISHENNPGMKVGAQACDLFLMSRLPFNTLPAKNTIYLEKNGNQLMYVVLDPKDASKIVRDTLYIDVSDEPLTKGELYNLAPNILEETSKRGHTIGYVCELGYVCGRIDKTIFNQNVDALIALLVKEELLFAHKKQKPEKLTISNPDDVDDQNRSTQVPVVSIQTDSESPQTIGLFEPVATPPPQLKNTIASLSDTVIVPIVATPVLETVEKTKVHIRTATPQSIPTNQLRFAWVRNLYHRFIAWVQGLYYRLFSKKAKVSNTILTKQDPRQTEDQTRNPPLVATLNNISNMPKADKETRKAADANHLPNTKPKAQP